MEVCERDNEVHRLREEIPLLVREMKAYTKFWQELLLEQQQLECALEAAASSAANAAHQLREQYKVCCLAVTGTLESPYLEQSSEAEAVNLPTLVIITMLYSACGALCTG